MFDWDYLGWKKYSDLFSYQNDWNQTLMTVLNMVNTKFHETNSISSTLITINQEVKKIFDTLEFFIDDKLTHRVVIVDNKLENNIIVVGNQDYPEMTIKIKILNYE